jgi:hypothetical protein
MELLWKDLGVDPGAGPQPRLEAVNRSEGDPPALSGQLLGTLRSYYAASNQALSAHLGRTVPW